MDSWRFPLLPVPVIIDTTTRTRNPSLTKTVGKEVVAPDRTQLRCKSSSNEEGQLERGTSPRDRALKQQARQVIRCTLNLHTLHLVGITMRDVPDQLCNDLVEINIWHF